MAASTNGKNSDSKTPARKKDDYYERTVLQPAARLIAAIEKKAKANVRKAAAR